MWTNFNNSFPVAELAEIKLRAPVNLLLHYIYIENVQLFIGLQIHNNYNCSYLI